MFNFIFRNFHICFHRYICLGSYNVLRARHPVRIHVFACEKCGKRLERRKYI